MIPKKHSEFNEVRIIDTKKKEILKSFKVSRKEQNICDIAITLDNRKIVCGGSSSTKIIVIDIESEQVTSVNTSHKKDVPWCQLTSDGKYLLSSSLRESRLWDVASLDRPEEMTPMFKEDIRFVGLFSQNRLCGGVVQDGLYSKWKLQVLAEFTSDPRVLDAIAE